MDDNVGMIIVSFNGDYRYNAQSNRWKYVSGSVFSLFVPLNISLEALLDKLYTQLGIDRAYEKLGVKVLFCHAGLEEMPPINIQDDWTLSGWIREATSKPNITFCVNSEPLERNEEPMIDLNEDANDLDDVMVGGCDLNDDTGINYHANTYRGADSHDEGIPEQELSFPVMDDVVQQLARDPNYNLFEPLHGSDVFETFPTQSSRNLVLGQEAVQFMHEHSQPSSSRGHTQFVGEFSSQYGQSDQQFQYPSCRFGQTTQHPSNFSSFTSFLNAPLLTNIPGGASLVPPGVSPNPRPTVEANFSWRMPTIEDSELPDCRTTGTISIDDVKELYIERMYESKDDFELKMHMYAVQNSFCMRLARSDPRDVSFVCADKLCKWRVRAKKMKESTQKFHITILVSTHTCASRIDNNDNPSAKPKVVAELYAHKLEELGNNYKPANIVEDMLKDYGISLNYDQAYRAHEAMTMMVRGSPKECYNMLPSYFFMLQKANEDTYVDLRVDGSGKFSTCFMALGASRRGFKFCRPILCVDAAHMKTRFKGQLFVAIAVDAGDHLFPIAIGVAESECNDAWVYFMRHLRLAIGGIHNEPLNFISDRHASIRHAVEAVFPDAYHGVCYHHLKGNLNSSWKDEGFCDITFHQAAYTCSKTHFQRVFGLMKVQCVGAATQLENIGFDRWTRAYFPGKRYALMTSNYAESFNNVVRGARRWPLPSMLERIRRMLQKWFYQRRNEALACTSELAPEIEKLVASHASEKMNFTVRPINADEFEVVGRTNTHGVVNLARRTCYCGKFQCLDAPCKHAVAAAGERRIRLSELCSAYYKADCFKQIYMGNIYPVANQEDWVVPESIRSMSVGVPNSRYAPDASGASRRGRVNTTRIPSEWERTRRTIVCGNCKHPGHNRAGCTQY